MQRNKSYFEKDIMMMSFIYEKFTNFLRKNTLIYENLRKKISKIVIEIIN